MLVGNGLAWFCFLVFWLNFMEIRRCAIPSRATQTRQVGFVVVRNGGLGPGKLCDHPEPCVRADAIGAILVLLPSPSAGQPGVGSAIEGVGGRPGALRLSASDDPAAARRLGG